MVRLMGRQNAPGEVPRSVWNRVSSRRAAHGKDPPAEPAQAGSAENRCVARFIKNTS